MKQTTFEIRAYGVGELAELYSPHMSHRAVSYTHLTLPTKLEV